MSTREAKKLGQTTHSRRDTLKYAAAGAAAMATGGLGSALAGERFDVVIRLVASAEQFQILPGATTSIYRYKARLLRGPLHALKSIPGSFLGPIMRFRTGQRVKIEFVNQLPEPTVLHLHGLHVPHDADGHPLHTLDPGQSWSHEFTVINQAGTYWYHAHTDMRTGYQVAKGLAGLIIVDDAIEDALPLPRGSYDVPIVIQDRRFGATNQIIHPTGSQTGSLGDRILINGVVESPIPVATRIYRLRTLNGCNSRILKLGWSDGSPVRVIGTEGGLMRHAVDKPYVMMGPGQRIEIWADFSNDPVGTERQLLSLPFLGGGPGSGYPAQGTQMTLQRFVVDRAEPETLQMPFTFRTFVPWLKEAAVNANNARVFAMEYMGMWTINGQTFELSGFTDDERVRLNDLELWELRNDLPNAARQPHPMHFHGPQYQIYRRTCDAADEAWYETVKDGFVDFGWHDTTLLFPGERVETLNFWQHYTGLFLYHCHNLEHEDMGMMRNLSIFA